MTRGNIVPVKELSDPNLLAEYREIARVIKNNYNMDGDYEYYILGKGHVKFLKKHTLFVVKRYKEICDEMIYRGFTVNYPANEFEKLAGERTDISNWNDYDIRECDIEINRQRIIERYKANPKAHRWTKREKPKYLEEVSV